DETFEEVDFSYVIKSTGKRENVETLEVLEMMTSGTEIKSITPQDGSAEPEPVQSDTAKIRLKEGQKIIRDNQTGISYNLLFGGYLVGSKEITVIDPYVRMPYQLRNFMEFAQLVSQKKNLEDEVKLHLVTNNNEDFIDGAKAAFAQMVDNLEPLGIQFSYEFDDNIHDRSINLDNGWKIVLGRGLDRFQKTGGWYDIAEYDQLLRRCKSCEITYVWGV